MRSYFVTLFSFFLFSSPLPAASMMLSGSVVSENQKSISSRYMGFVQEVNVGEGDRVKKGDVLYVIDSKEVDSALEQANLAISQAELSLSMYENQYANAKLNLERHERLLSKDMVSKYDVETLALNTSNLQALVGIAKKQVAIAKQKRQEVQNQYAYLRVKAPNNGVITEKHIKAGEMALAGVPTFVLADLSDLSIVSEIAESAIKEVKIGDSARIEIPSIGCKSDAKVISIIPSANTLAHTFKLKLSFKCESAYPGMYATVGLGE